MQLLDCHMQAHTHGHHHPETLPDLQAPGALLACSAACAILGCIPPRSSSKGEQPCHQQAVLELGLDGSKGRPAFSLQVVHLSAPAAQALGISPGTAHAVLLAALQAATPSLDSLTCMLEVVAQVRSCGGWMRHVHHMGGLTCMQTASRACLRQAVQ